MLPLCSFAGTHFGNDGGIGLEFAVEMHVGVEFVSHTGGLDDLVNQLVLGAALCGEAEDGDTGVFKSGYSLGGLCGNNGYLTQFFSSGAGGGGTVGEDKHAVLAVGGVFENHDESTADDADAGQGLDNLESGTEQSASPFLISMQAR